MRTVSVAYQLYTYEELDRSAKERAFSDFCNNGDYPYGSENEATLNAFENIFPIKVRDWEYGYRHYINFYMDCDDVVSELTGTRLATYLWNNYKDDIFKGKYFLKSQKHRHSKIMLSNDCVLTGYYLDMNILEPIYKFLDKPNSNVTFNDLMEECLNNWVRACESDYEYYYSEENFKEICEDTEPEFTVDGRIF